MKKAFPWILCAVLALALAGCLLYIFLPKSEKDPYAGSPKFPTDEQHIKYGKKALEIADAYLDFEISLEEAKERIDLLCDASETLPKGSEEQETGNLYVEIDVSYLQLTIFNAAMRAKGLTGLASKGSADVLEARNGLARTLGVKER